MPNSGPVTKYKVTGATNRRTTGCWDLRQGMYNAGNAQSKNISGVFLGGLAI